MPRFRPEDTLAEVQRTVKTKKPAKELGGGVTVAIFDTWPMEYVPPQTPLDLPSPFAFVVIAAFRV